MSKIDTKQEAVETKQQDKFHISSSSGGSSSSSSSTHLGALLPDPTSSSSSSESYINSRGISALASQISYMSSPTETFVVKSVRDHWQDHSYHHRYLDAMASIFAVQSPCAAIAYFTKKQKFYLSYNANAAPNALSKITLIQGCLNAPNNINQQEFLLFLYLAYNTDFSDALSGSYNIFEPTDVYKYKISDSDSSDSNSRVQTTIDAFSARVQALSIKTQKQDEIAQKVKDQIDLLVSGIQEINGPKRSIIDPREIETRKSKIAAKSKISGNDSFSVVLYDKVLGSYNALLRLLSEDNIEIEDKSEDFFELARILLRPLQDVEKVLYYLNPDHLAMKSELLCIFTQPSMVSTKDQVQDIVELIAEYTIRNVDVEVIASQTIESGKTVHTESNLGKLFRDTDLYIGISRLCCGICDHLLTSKYYLEHRGTHGTCDPKWGAPTLSLLSFFEEVYQKSIGIDQSNKGSQLSHQHRELSNDNLQSLLMGADVPDHDFMFQHFKDILLAGETESS